MTTLTRLVAFVSLLLTLPVAFAIDSVAGPYKVQLVTDPAVVPVGKANIRVSITSGGQPVPDAKVSILAKMPTMNMGESEQEAPEDFSNRGTYVAPAVFAMAGGYEARVTIDGKPGHAVATISLATGQSTAQASGSFPWGIVVVAVVAVGLTGWIVVRMRKLGMETNPKGAFNRSTISGLLLIAVVISGAVWAVNNLRRPGAMTPLEAQGMEMNTPAPEGVVPVTTALAENGTIQETVKYSGQAVGYNEQDVFARVSGAVTELDLYVGDTIHKGQVLAHLDTRQTAPNASDKAAGIGIARSGVESARADLRKAEADVHFAEAELNQYTSGVEVSKADLEGAKQDKESAVAAIAAAEADLNDAQARVTSAEADNTYWIAELKRAYNLLQADVYSKDEYQKEKAEADKAEAALTQANQGVLGAKARLAAAKAADKKADAGLLSAQKKVESAMSERMTKHASIMKSQADLEAAKARLSQARLAVVQASAQSLAARTDTDFSKIVSPIDGVITQRIVSPGTLVQPGQSILKIAQIAPIRLQANVASVDLDRIELGSPVMISRKDGTMIEAKVSSVQPSVEAGARTGIVEALVPNADHTIRPGEFVQMSIKVGKPDTGVLVPDIAVQSGTDGTSYIWTVSGKQAHRQIVKTGVSDGTKTTILEGLAAGTTVITSGFINVRDGATLSAQADAPDTPVMSVSTDLPQVKVTENGFEPETLDLPKGTTKVVFTRLTDATCAKEVVFKDPSLKKDLPLNKPVTIDVKDFSPGTHDYACGMDMIHGKVVIR